jgi:hypothetical protein
MMALVQLSSGEVIIIALLVVIITMLVKGLRKR